MCALVFTLLQNGPILQCEELKGTVEYTPLRQRSRLSPRCALSLWSCGTGCRFCQTVWEYGVLVDTSHINLVLGEIFGLSKVSSLKLCPGKVSSLKLCPSKVGSLEQSLCEAVLL